MMQKRTILIAGIGNSPQVLTEMVWELAHLKRPIVPDEIVALAAKDSAEKLKTELLSGGEKSVWAGLVAALKREKIDVAGKLRFGTASIAVLPDAVGNEMQDLRSGDDSLLAADFILGQLRRFTESSDTIVYASIAGGRKTMSALMFSCMTLVGRDEDKIVHVLPPAELEGGSSPVFYYPQKGVKFVSTHTGKAYKGEKLRSEYLEIPFVRTRGWYQDKFKTSAPSYQTLVRGVQHVAPPAVVWPKIEIDAWTGSVKIDGKEVSIGKAAFAALLLAAGGMSDSRKMRELLCQAHANRSDVWCSWFDKFKEGGRFATDDAKSLDDFTKVTNELRKALELGGLADAAALVPKKSGQIRYPVDQIVWVNREKMAEVCGCLFLSSRQ